MAGFQIGPGIPRIADELLCFRFAVVQFRELAEQPTGMIPDRKHTRVALSNVSSGAFHNGSIAGFPHDDTGGEYQAINLIFFHQSFMHC